MKNTFIACIAIIVFAAATASAHHSFAAEFDANKPVKFQGTVIKMEWINPHPWIHVDVKDADGSTKVWMIETAAPNSLIRRGFTKNSLPVGSVINIEGFQARDGSLRANGRELAFQDGRKLFLSSAGTGAPDEKGAAK
jgi:hypothetical protein